jgi:hypothetical protein
MATTDPEDLERIDREIRIELKHEAEELAGGEMTVHEADDCPPEMAEQFWEHVVAFEKAPWTSHFLQLLDAGVELPDPADLGDEALTAKLWELIDRLAGLRVFLSNTDHLSDRELYTHLWGEALHERIKDVAVDEFSACHLDILGGGSEEDIYLHLKYYADEEWRADWARSFPGYEVPPHEDPPYDRDRHLPRPTYGPA